MVELIKSDECSSLRWFVSYFKPSLIFASKTGVFLSGHHSVDWLRDLPTNMTRLNVTDRDKRSSLQWFVTVSHFNPSLIFASKTGVFLSGHHSVDWLRDLPTNMTRLNVTDRDKRSSLQWFVTVSYFKPSLIFAGKTGAFPSRLHSEDWP